MIPYVAVLATDRDGSAVVPAACVAALRVAGTHPGTRHETGAFACATATSEPAVHGIRVDRSVVIVGDVRLDGAAALRAALAPRERAVDDLGLVLLAYREWGALALDRLRGDFSVSIWDAERREMIAARDGLGVRPLYFARVRGGVIASNVLNAIRAYPGVRADLHAPAVASFLHLGWNAGLSTTTFADVDRLAPGTALRCGSGAPDTRGWRHWSMPDPAPVQMRRDEEYAERYRELLRQSVCDRVDPRGTLLLLSGGMDSTSIASTARDSLPGARLSALTWRTTDVEGEAEADLAAAVARRLSIPHTIVNETASSALADHAHTPEPLDEPEHALTTSVIARQADLAGARVVIEGEDGDALFLPPGLSTMLRRESPLRVVGRIASYIARERRKPFLGIWLSRRLGLSPHPSPPSPPPWLTPTARAALGDAGSEDGRPTQARPAAARALTRSIWQSVHDGYSRAWSGVPADYRWPLLDSRLIEFVFSIPAVPWCQQKHLARRAFAGVLPEAVIRRPKAPLPGYSEALARAWQSAHGGTRVALHERTSAYVDADALRTALESADAERVTSAWRALQLDRWIRRESA